VSNEGARTDGAFQLPHLNLTDWVVTRLQVWGASY